MKLIELHILQSFPVTCLNRDDLGAPKSAMFGGVERARVSSQCWKRAVREFAHETSPVFSETVRTKKLKSFFEKVFEEVSCTNDLAKRDTVIDRILETKKKVNGKDVFLFGKTNEDSEVDTLFYISKETAKKLVSFVNEKLREDTKYKPSFSDLSKVLTGQVSDAADIALFGRMVAADATNTIEGAALFSHALSTHAVRSELDFFSAVDDEKKDADDAGAGQIGNIEYNSACYYRYIGVNLDLLKESKLFDQSQIKAVLENFIRAAILANPAARKNSMFGQGLPSYVLAVKRSGQPLSLANAFEKPVQAKRGSGYVEPSIDAIKKEWTDLKAAFGLDAGVECEIQKGKDGTASLPVLIQNLLADIA